MIKFEKTAGGMKLMAAYIAGLTREGIAYKVTETAGFYGIEATGF